MGGRNVQVEWMLACDTMKKYWTVVIHKTNLEWDSYSHPFLDDGSLTSFLGYCSAKKM